MLRIAAGALGALVVLASSSPALGHIRLDVPPNRYGDQKDGPCGAADDQRTDRVTVYEPGETITVEWEETIDHPSHYRIAFSREGTEDFEDPTYYDDYYTNEAVLLDEIPDREGGGAYEAEVTLPDEPCDRCTLQLIQVMYDKEPWSDNDLYWQCADLKLRDGGAAGDGGPDISPDPPEEGGGCHLAGGSGPAAALLVGIALFSLCGTRARRPRAG